MGERVEGSMSDAAGEILCGMLRGTGDNGGDVLGEIGFCGEEGVDVGSRGYQIGWCCGHIVMKVGDGDVDEDCTMGFEG